jgi:hypothetical protein
MERVTVSVDGGVLAALKQQAGDAGTSLSAFAARELRNAALRHQLADAPLDEVSGWLDDAEADGSAQAGAA